MKSVLSRALSCAFQAGRMPSESIAWRLEINRERFKKEWLFSHKELFTYKAMGKTSSCPILPVRVLHECSESCTDILHIFRKCSKVMLPPGKALMCPSPTCHEEINL